ncbi:MAG: hypothetical protein JO256_14275 [Alphaproteobacteria bacterium]|nr:hypothetical protein [Alphaproteobacteria bacterium]
MPMHKPALAAQSWGSLVPLERLDAELVRAGMMMWRALKHEARFPCRARMTSCLTTPLRDGSFLVEVLEEGADYRYRDVGAALVRGFNADFSGRRLSGIITEAPRFGLGMRMLYEMVRAAGEPLGYRGWVGEDLPDAAFVHHESVILPLGEEQAVDHLLVVSSLVLRQGS